MFLRLVIFTLCLCSFSAITQAGDNMVIGLSVSGLEQRVDDEEAPFDIHSSNKIHNCGGKPSNVYRVYSEYEAVAQRRFLLALEAFTSRMTLTVYTDGCDGRALKIHSLRLTR